MKRKNFRLSLGSLVVFLLVGVMCASAAFTSFTSTAINSIGSVNSAVSAGADIDVELKDVLDPDKIEGTVKTYSDDDTVSLIITMNDTSLVDIWLANPQGYAEFSDYRSSVEGQNAAENLIKKQNALFNKIARNEDATLTYNYVNTMNGFAIDIKYGDRSAIDEIAYKANVKSTVLATHYDVPEIEAVENQVTAYETGIFNSEDSVYKKHIAGQGTVAAILDTGLDWEHIAFSPNHPLFHKADQEANGTLKIKYEDIERLLAMKNGLLTSVRTRIPEEGHVYSAKASAKDLYKNEKVVFTFDYADKDNEVSSDVDNAHGTHVAGIVAGHSDTPYQDKDGKNYMLGKDDALYRDDYGTYAGKYYTYENGKLVIQNDIDPSSLSAVYDPKTKKQITGITGVAPQAQLAIFKVFSDFDSGAKSDSLYAALEDCMTLGVDVINMSLGSDSGFQVDDGAMDSVYEVYDRVGKSGISLVVAASNSYSSGFNSHYGLNLISNPDSATVGSPSTYDAAISVASISGVKSKYLSATNGFAIGDSGYQEYGVAYYQDAAHVNGESYDFMEDLFIAIDKKNVGGRLDKYILERDDSGKILRAQIPYVTILGVGDRIDYVGKDVQDKIALVPRGDISFEDKVKIAKEKGAIGCIIFNNAAGIIRMQVGDDIKHDEVGDDGEKINFPACSITMDAAAPIRDKDMYATGSVNPSFVFDSRAEAGPFMSEFSSWGPLPNLLLKPEITAHGGEIYSAIPGDETAYSRFSGTSMACPNMAGVVALLRQYMKQKDASGNYVNAEKFDLWQYEYEKDASGNVVFTADGNRKYALNADGSKKIVTVDGKKQIDLNVLEQRIYQILMSTTTIAKDEQGNPYSPRRQGSGLADLNRAETTEQYIYLKDSEGMEKERTKLELLDDADRKAEYKMEFYVRNVGASDVEYSINADVLTEGKSTDLKTVNEKARPIAYDPTLLVNDETHDVNTPFTVPHNGEVKITYTVKLQQSAIDWLETFPNGMYVEGFVRLNNTSTAEDAISLSVPFLAFYGNWADAPIIDYDIFETSKDLYDDNINDDNKRYAGARPVQLLGKIAENGQEFVLGLGQFPFIISDDLNMDPPAAEEDKCALSFDSDNSMFNLYCAGGLLRGAKKMFYTIKDVATGRIIKQDCYFAARKSAGAGGIGGAWIDIDVKDLGVVNNAQYNITIYPVLDWHSERYPSDRDPVTNEVKASDIEQSIAMITEEGEKWNEEHKDDGRAKRYMWSCNFWIDTDAPFISDTTVRADRDRNGDETHYIDLALTDNHYLSAMGLYIYDEHESKYESIFDGLRPVDSSRNSTTLMSFNISDYWDQISEGLLLRMNNRNENVEGSKGMKYTTIQVVLYDYAFNRSFYTIDLLELLKSQQHTDVAFGQTGNYRTYSCEGQDDVNILVSTKKEIATDENGEYLTIESLTLVPGQKVNLKNAIISYPETAWREELEFSVTPSDNSVIRFDDDTYELYAVMQNDPATGEYQRASATLTVRSKINRSISKDLKVYVLTNEEVDAYKINASSLRENSELSNLVFEKRTKDFNAGESYVIEAEVDPWFAEFDSGKYFVGWESSTDLLATVEPLSPNDPEYQADRAHGPLKAKVTANCAKRDANGNYIDENGEPCKYVKNNVGMAMITPTIYRIITQEEYNAHQGDSNYILDSFSGQYGVRMFRGQSFYANVLEEFVVSGNKLDEYHGIGGNVVIPDNLSITTISSMLFIRRADITSITFGEGVETIERAACAYMPNLTKVVFPSTLQTIGEYAFTASFSSSAAGPDTKLSIIDTSACTIKPFKVAEYAFAMQRYIGVDMEKSRIVDKVDSLYSTQINNTIVLLDKSIRDKFDTRNLRLAGAYSFYGMRFANNLDFSGLKAAGVAAFYEYAAAYNKYTNLREVGTATFGAETFAGESSFLMHGIKRLVLPMNRVNLQMFAGSSALDEIVFTGDQLVIEDGGFLSCSVTKITFNCDVYSIGDQAFYADRNLNTVEFKGKCKEIGARAFANTALRSIKLPAGLETLGAGAFANCSSLNKVEINSDTKLTADQFGVSSSVSVTEGAPFMGCTALKQFTTDAAGGTINDTLTVKNGIIYGDGGERIICVPAGFDSNDLDNIFQGVKSIGAYAFGGVRFKSNTTIDLSATNVTRIEEGAFYSTNIVGLKLNNKITEIGTAAFLGCTSLASIEFGADSKLQKIDAYAFYGSSTSGGTYGSLRTLQLPKTLTDLGEYAFAYQTRLTSVEFLGDGVKSIKNSTFRSASSLTEIKMLNSTSNTLTDNTLYVNSIGSAAFMGAKLATLDLPNVKTIGSEAFYGCNLLTTINMPNVTTIGRGAFRAMSASSAGGPATSLIRVNVGNAETSKLTRIDSEAFLGQTKLTSLELSTVKTIGDSAFEGSGIRSVNLAAVNKIGEFAFAESAVSETSGGKFVVPANAEYIASTAFAGSAITAFDVSGEGKYFADNGVLYENTTNGSKVLIAYPSASKRIEYTVSDGTVRIDDFAFTGSVNLAVINIPASVKAIGDGAFYDSSVLLYNFGGLTAPELETSHESFHTTSNDHYYWQLYRNFRKNFNYNLEGETYKYNSIRQMDEYDEVTGLVDDDGNRLSCGVNTSAVGGGFAKDESFGIVLCRPANASGFDSFVWTNYFDTVMITPEVREPAVDEVERLIGALPESNTVTLSNRESILYARGAYDRLSNAQKDFVNADLITKLEACEEALAALDNGGSKPSQPSNPQTATPGDAVKTLIDNIPVLGDDATDEEIADAIAAVQAAQAAYDALSDADKAKVTNADKLESAKEQIETKTGSSVKPLVPSGEEGGFSIVTLFIGLAAGLAVAAIVCLISLLVIRKKRAKADK